MGHECRQTLECFTHIRLRLKRNAVTSMESVRALTTGAGDPLRASSLGVVSLESAGFHSLAALETPLQSPWFSEAPGGRQPVVHTHLQPPSPMRQPAPLAHATKQLQIIAFGPLSQVPGGGLDLTIIWSPIRRDKNQSEIDLQETHPAEISQARHAKTS